MITRKGSGERSALCSAFAFTVGLFKVFWIIGGIIAGRMAVEFVVDAVTFGLQHFPRIDQGGVGWHNEFVLNFSEVFDFQVDLLCAERCILQMDKALDRLFYFLRCDVVFGDIKLHFLAEILSRSRRSFR